ncbi:MAG: hypothetical protein HY868_23425 [Chloroflexi bacterium]|nr:hypothetical protein [Chloroflexota bacterium]
MLKKILPFFIFIAILVGYAVFDRLVTQRTPTDSPDSLQVVLVPSEIVLGWNRFAVGLISKQGMVHDAQVQFQYFDVSNATSPVAESSADATRIETSDGTTTIYAHEREFTRAGDWSVQVTARLSDGTTASKRIGFKVLADSPTLKVGKPAPALNTRTAKDVNGDLSLLSSAPKSNPAFYRLTLAQALASGKPTVLLFATPAFCRTRFCAPAYDIADALEKEYGARANFVHVEVYTGMPNPAGNNWQLDPAMRAFGLTTEPWVYVIDTRGIVAYRVEGVMTEAELAQHLTPLLQ